MNYMIRTTGILRNILAAVLLTAMAACTEDMDVPGSTATEGREATVRLSVSVAPVGTGMPGSRALPEGVDEGTDPDYEVKDIWLMEYNDAGEIVGSPQYYTREELKDGGINVPIILPVGDAVFKCVVVANTHIPDRINEAIGDVSTLAKLRALCRKVSTPDDMHNKNHDADNNPVKGGDLLMNCVMDIQSTTTELDCKLYRNIAKFTLKLKNKEGSGVNVNTVQLCNVPDKMFYADRLYGSEQGTKYPSPTLGEAGFRTWEVEYVKEENKDADGVWTFEYYLPRNCRGTNDNTAGPSEKNRNAPDFATYVEIMAEDAVNHTPVRYRFYLGENMTDNFNVIPNRHYILPVTIEGKGASTDSRVEDMGNLKLPESNCYIVNPLNGGAQQLHSVPITRINKFWDSVDGKIATDDAGKPEDNHVYHDTKWVAEVIWQDASTRLFDFCDKDGNILSGDEYTGTGEADFHFKPREGARGNVLIGVRRETQNKSNYLWSWHLWITDYNPDERTAGWNEGLYIYNVSGGAVHRYADKNEDTGFWANNKDKYTMDRNIGALEADEDHYDDSRGFYYQFGRKDPFPHSKTPLYDINGNLLQDVVGGVKNAVNLYQAVKRPHFFYDSGSAWLADNKYNNRVWRNPTWNAESTTKSIFDPSPPGWKIPVSNTGFANSIWGIFALPDETPNAVCSSYATQQNTPIGWNFYIAGFGEGEKTWFPCSGQRTISSVSSELGSGLYWFADNHRYMRTITSSKVYLHQFSYTPGAFSLRCVKE